MKSYDPKKHTFIKNICIWFNECSNKEFNKFCDIKTLDISSFKLQDDYFKNLGNLENLEINSCGCGKEFSYKAFQYLKSLKKLKITFSYIQMFNSDCLKCLTKLEDLYLGAINEFCIDPGNFTYIKNLKKLYLNNADSNTDNIKILKNGFKDLTNLTHLYLVNFDNFRDDMFGYLINLVYLYMNKCGCKSNTFTKNIFKNLKNLVKLELFICNRKLYDLETIKPLLKLKELNVVGSTETCAINYHKIFPNLKFDYEHVDDTF